MSKLATIVEDGIAVTGVEIARMTPAGPDLLCLMLSNGLAAYDRAAAATVTVRTADGRFHQGLEKR